MTIAPPFKQADNAGVTDPFAVPRMMLRFAFKDTRAACVALTKGDRKSFARASWKMERCLGVGLSPCKARAAGGLACILMGK